MYVKKFVKSPKVSTFSQDRRKVSLILLINAIKTVTSKEDEKRNNDSLIIIIETI